MSNNDDNLLAKLREQFLADPDDQVGLIEEYSSKLSDAPDTAIRDLMRVAHNLKGAAQLAGENEFGKAVHELETLFQNMAKYQLSKDDTENCVLLIRRLGTLLRKKFEALKGSEPFDTRDQSAWDVTVQGLTIIASNSPPKANDQTEVASNAQQADAGSENFDDWGLNSASTEPQKNEAPIIHQPEHPPEQQLDADPKSKLQQEVDQGWGIFEDEPVTATPAQPVSAVTAAVSSKAEKSPSKVVQLPVVDQKIQNDPKEDPADTYLLCHQDQITYALPVRFVQEIMPNRELKNLPIKRKNIAGVISFRGQVMPVMELIDQQSTIKLKDQAPTKSSQPSGCIVVCQVGRKLFGFRIEQVSTVIEIKDNQLQAVHTKLDLDETRLVSHLSHIDGKSISFLDLSGAISA